MKQRIYYIITSLLIIATSCTKFLNEKPDQQLIVPSRLEDLQALLDDYYNINQQDPEAGARSSDNYYLTYNDWKSTTDEQQRRVYIWEKTDLFHTIGNTEWSLSYDNVYRANIVLDGLTKIERSKLNDKKWDNIQGQALFLRGKCFLQIANIWSPAYNPKLASTDLGIPLRLSPDFNKPSVRSSVQETYQQIIKDLKLAAELLPKKPIHKLRSSKPAAYALLARTYLAIGNYSNALKYADSSLKFNSKLLNYNTVDSTLKWTFSPRFSNPEVLIDMLCGRTGTLSYRVAKVDTVLYRSYSNNDLRKALFFMENEDGTHAFRGSYNGIGSIFSGIAIDEVYLTKAECLARLGNPDKGMKTLNELLVTRWRAGTFEAFIASDQANAIKKILEERRKELLMRNIRWMDIKRLNMIGANIILKRKLNKKIYILSPNDKRYALPIPEDVIKLTGMTQNPR